VRELLSSRNRTVCELEKLAHSTTKSRKFFERGDELSKRKKILDERCHEESLWTRPQVKKGPVGTYQNGGGKGGKIERLLGTGTWLTMGTSLPKEREGAGRPKVWGGGENNRRELDKNENFVSLEASEKKLNPLYSIYESCKEGGEHENAGRKGAIGTLSR